MYNNYGIEENNLTDKEVLDYYNSIDIIDIEDIAHVLTVLSIYDAYLDYIEEEYN